METRNHELELILQQDASFKTKDANLRLKTSAGHLAPTSLRTNTQHGTMKNPFDKDTNNYSRLAPDLANSE